MGQDLIHFNNPLHGEMITRALDPDQPFREGFDICISRTSGGKLAGGVTYDGYLKRSICIHTAGFVPNWLSREFLWAAFSYPFYQLKVEVIYGIVQSTNERAMRFDQKLGFKEDTRLKGAIPGGDLVFFSMYRADCKWLKMKPPTRDGIMQ